MANVRIKDLPTNTPAPASWFAAEVMTTPGLFTTSRAQLSSVINAGSNPLWESSAQTVFTLSGNWNSTYVSYFLQNKDRLWSALTTVSAFSGIWTAAYNTLIASTGAPKWDIASVQASSVWTTTNTFSSNWQLSNSVFTTVRSNSAGWGGQSADVYNTVNPLSGYWTSASTTVTANSARWTSVFNSVSPVSGRWQSVYSYVNSVSSITPRRFAADVGDGTNSTFALVHNFGTRDVITQVYRNSTGSVYGGPGSSPTPPSNFIVNTDVNTVTLNFASAPIANQFRVVILG